MFKSKKYKLINQVIKYTHYDGNEKDKYKRYRQLVFLYEKNEEEMKDIINDLEKYASFKAYFYLLSMSKNQDLDKLIFAKLVNTYNDDVKNYRNQKSISSLAKWLPREKLHFDKKINFVNTFVTKLYPEMFEGIDPEKDVKQLIKTLNVAKKKYRKSIAEMNKYIDTLEPKLCQKTGNIDFYKLSKTQINKYFFKFMKENEFEFANFLEINYENMGANIIDYIQKNKIKHELDRKICDQSWQIIKKKHNNMYTQNLNKVDLLIDITQDLYEMKIINDIFMFLLIASEQHKNLYVGEKKLIMNNNKDIFDQISSINNLIMPNPTLIIPKGTNKTLYVVTTKDIDNIENFQNYKEIVIFSPNCENKNLFVLKKKFQNKFEIYNYCLVCCLLIYDKIAKLY